MKRVPRLYAMVATILPMVVAMAWAGDPPAAPPLSKVAPAADLIKQVDLYVAGFRDGLVDEATYADKSRQIAKDAHTLAVVGLVLAMHDENHPMKEAALPLSRAARQLADAKDYPSAKKAFEELTKAGGGSAQTPKWEKVASLGQLMKQVTFVNNRLRRNMRRFEERADDNARDAAILAVIAQAVTFDTHEVKDPAQVDKWYELCGQMRDAAGELNAQIHAKDKTAAEAALGKMGKSCDACHATFRVVTTP
ncbi:MAG: cytochrome c [Planctomycetia bacterium]|nr:cytochrome c [Planctomycetia bacterium]